MNPYYRCILSVTIWLFVAGFLSAQFTANYWPLNEQSIDFSTSPPNVANEVPYEEAYATTSIGDAAGNQLFFATAQQVYNAIGEPLAGGNFEDINEFDVAEQPLLVPIPESEGHFLLFVKLSGGIATSGDGSIVNEGGFYIVELDIALNGGTGGVVPGSRRHVGTDYIFQQLTAVQDPSSGNYWVLGRHYTGVQLAAYRITDAGLDDAPVVTNVDLPPVDHIFFDTQLKFSPDAKYVASAYSTSVFDENSVSGFILLDFNPATGVLDLRETIDLPTSGRNASGIEFSSNATKLYAYQTGSSGEEGLYQYDLTVLPERIAPTQIDLGELEMNGGDKLQLAPDGKIYITKGGGSSTGANYLGVINQPNDLGVAADFVELGLFIAEGVDFGTSVRNLPTVVQSFYYRNSIHLDLACENQEVEFSPANNNLAISTEWDFGDGSPVSADRNPRHVYTEVGSYTVRLIVGGALGLDTLTRVVTVLPSTTLDLGEDRSICVGSFISPIGQVDDFATYVWNTGDTAAMLRIDTAGTYTLTAVNTQGCPALGSITLGINLPPEISLADTIEITGDSISVTPGDFERYTWSTGDTTSTLIISEPRFYSVVVEDSLGCRADNTFLTYRGALPPPVREEAVWRLINPRPSTSNARRVHHLDADNGFIVTDEELLVTRTGGQRWEKTLAVNQALDIQFTGRTGYLMSQRSLYQSTFNGRAWNRLPISGGPFVGLSLIGSDTIILASNDANQISTDGGRTWLRRVMSLSEFTPAVIRFTSSLKGFSVSTEGDLYATDDGGNTWEQRGEAPRGNTSTDHQIVFFDDQLGFATRGRWGIYRTTDGGQTWTEPNLGTTRYFGIDFIDKSHAYLVGELGAVAFTDNGGITWESRNSGLNFNDGWGDATFTDRNSGTAVGSVGRIATTQDGGRTWQNYAPSYRRIDNAHLNANGSGHMISQGGYFTTVDDGANWLRNTAIVEGEQTLDVIQLNDSIELALVEITSRGVDFENTLHRTQNSGETWEMINLDLGRSEEFDDLQQLDDSVAHVTTIDGSPNRTFRTSDGGRTWEEIAIPLLEKVALVDDTLAYGIRDRSLYRSTDGGLSWTLNYSITSGSLNDFAFPSASCGYLVGESGVRLRTIDGGREWTIIEGLEYDDYLAVDFPTPRRGYALNDGGLIYSTDNAGESWQIEFREFGLQHFKLTDSLIISYGDFGRFYARSVTAVPTATITSIVQTAITDITTDLRLNILSDIDTVRVEIIIRSAENNIEVYSNDEILFTSAESNLNIQIDGLDPSTRYILNASILTLTDDIVSSERFEFITTDLVNTPDPSRPSELILYPSPTLGPLHYKLPGGVGPQLYRLLDVNGRLILSGLLRQGYGRLDLTPYPSGLYFLQLGSVNHEIVSYPIIRL